MAIKSTMDCDMCKKQLIDGDYVFCNVCFTALEDRITELEEEKNKEKNNERHQI